MPDVWQWSAVVGVLAGLAVFALLFIPTLAWESRRFGRLRLWRTVAAGAAAVYGVTLLVYVFLPFPAADWCETNVSPSPELRPFHSIDEIRTATEGLSVIEALGTFAVLQVVMNVALFVPWGAFSRRLFGRAWWVGVLSAFLMSVFIEVSQGTAMWGFFDCAYRTADVDDVITNTFGALVGVALAPALLFWVPEVGPDVARREEPKPVTRRRRLAGMAVDLGAFLGCWVLLSAASRGLRGVPLRPTVLDQTAWLDRTVPGLVAVALVVVLPMVVGSGASLGQRTMWLVPDPGPRRLLKTAVRLVVGLGGFAGAWIVASVPEVSSGTETAAVVVGWVIVAVSGVSVLLDRTARGASFRASHVALADRRQLDRDATAAADPGGQRAR
jgi:glycopeptide antibiotics resistance protein